MPAPRINHRRHAVLATRAMAGPLSIRASSALWAKCCNGPPLCQTTAIICELALKTPDAPSPTLISRANTSLVADQTVSAAPRSPRSISSCGPDQRKSRCQTVPPCRAVRIPTRSRPKGMYSPRALDGACHSLNPLCISGQSKHSRVIIGHIDLPRTPSHHGRTGCGFADIRVNAPLGQDPTRTCDGAFGPEDQTGPSSLGAARSAGSKRAERIESNSGILTGIHLSFCAALAAPGGIMMLVKTASGPPNGDGQSQHQVHTPAPQDSSLTKHGSTARCTTPRLARTTASVIP